MVWMHVTSGITIFRIPPGNQIADINSKFVLGQIVFKKISNTFPEKGLSTGVGVHEGNPTY